MAAPAKGKLTAGFKCVAELVDGEVKANLFGKDGKLVATAQNVERDSWRNLLDPVLPDSVVPKPLSKEWVGVGEAWTPQRYNADGTPKIEARMNEGGFKIDPDQGTCTVQTVDGGGVSNKPVVAPLTVKGPSP